MECNVIQKNEPDVNFIPYSLLCERLANPEAIDACTPGFSWKAHHPGRRKIQTAYRITVSSTLEKLLSGKYDMWDSGKCGSRQSLDVQYNGKQLLSMSDNFWHVKLWDSEDAESEWSEPARFGMGILPPDFWEADWLSYPYPGKEALMFRHEFSVQHQLRRAKLLISGLGYYELHINGKKVGDHLLDPAWTDYTKRVFYAGYNVTEYLHNGLNAIGVILGKGWYGSPWLGQIAKPSQLLLQLLVEYSDGSREIVSTNRDAGWLVTNEGPVRDNSIYNGEIYDARMEQPGWSEPCFQIGTDWKKPIIVSSLGGKLAAQPLEPIKAVEQIKPVGVTSPRAGIYVVDFGQNISGVAGLGNICGSRGCQLTLKYAEILGEDGLINCENLRTTVCDTYILSGSSNEEYTPRFTYHGFRYFQVEGLVHQLSTNDVIGYHLRSAVGHIGRFNCSNEILNRLHQCIVWTEADNLYGIPTDCPQRDERLGWLNDMTVRAEESLYNFDLNRLYAKWIDDINDTQDNLGAIADTAPVLSFGRKPADPVCSSYILIPWLLYVHHGDIGVIKKHFDNLLAWNNYLALNSSGHIVEYSSYGDWASPIGESNPDSIGAGAVSSATPGEFMSTGYYYMNYILLGKMAALLGRNTEAAVLNEKAERVKKAFNKKYFNAQTGTYATGSQASQVFPLYLGIAPDQHITAIIRHLVRDIEARGIHLSTGNQCTKYMIEILTQNGQSTLALALATQTTYPSWGFMLESGATTIWERWERVVSGPMCAMASHNHPMNATIGSWFYRYLVGIMPIEEAPGFSRFKLKPFVLDGLDYAEASLETVRGRIVSSWHRTETGIVLYIEIPFNSEAEIAIESNGPTPRLMTDDKAGIKGVCTTETSDGFTKIIAGSGSYRFAYAI